MPGKQTDALHGVWQERRVETCVANFLPVARRKTNVKSSGFAVHQNQQRTLAFSAFDGSQNESKSALQRRMPVSVAHFAPLDVPPEDVAYAKVVGISAEPGTLP